MAKKTYEQRWAEKAVAAWCEGQGYKEPWPSCEQLRGRLLRYAEWLRGQAEALRHPVTRWRTLVDAPPVLVSGYLGEGIDDVVADVKEIGWVASAVAHPEVLRSGLHAVDMVLGRNGGLQPGYKVLLARECGAGGTTLMMQFAAAVAFHSQVVYVHGLEYRGDVVAMFERLGLSRCVDDSCHLVTSATGMPVQDIVDAVRKVRPALVVIDDVTFLSRAEVSGLLTKGFTDDRKQEPAVVFLARITKPGKVAWLKAWQDAADVVLRLDREPGKTPSRPVSVLRLVKHRDNDEGVGARRVEARLVLTERGFLE